MKYCSNTDAPNFLVSVEINHRNRRRRKSNSSAVADKLLPNLRLVKLIKQHAEECNDFSQYQVFWRSESITAVITWPHCLTGLRDTSSDQITKDFVWLLWDNRLLDLFHHPRKDGLLENRYVGDVGDFGKYGLLKALCLPSKVSGGYNLSLGVVWYLVPDEPGSDGKHTRYLKDSSKNLGLYRSCDPGLYDSLRDIVCGHRRRVSAIRKEGILPSGTVFYEESLTFDARPGIGLEERDRRLAYRSEWVQRALDQVTGCDLVFIDPDNGLSVDSTAKHHKRGPKYAFIDELSPYLEKGQSLVIYQHISRRGTADSQVDRWLSCLDSALKGSFNPFALMFRRGTARAFLIVPTQAHSNILSDMAEQLMQECWGKQRHFTLHRLRWDSGLA